MSSPSQRGVTQFPRHTFGQTESVTYHFRSDRKCDGWGGLVGLIYHRDMTEGNQQQSIEALAAEQRMFPPPADFAANALVSDRSMYDEASADHEGFWARQASELVELDQAVEHRARVEPAVLEVVPRRSAERRRQLPRPPRRCWPRRQGGDPLGGRAGRHPRHHLRRDARRGEQVRQRAQGPRRRQGRPGHDLHADDPRGCRRDARLCPHRRTAPRRVRRVLGPVGRRPDRRRRGQARDHRRRWLPPRFGVRAQAGGRRCDRQDRRPSSRSSSSSAAATRSRWSTAATTGTTS